MISAEYHPAGRRSTSLAALERDAALVRVSRARRWMIAGAAALSAAIAALVSSTAPGHTLGSRGQATASTTGSARSASSIASSKTLPPLASPGELGLQGPSSVPQSAATVSPATPDPSQSSQASPNPVQAAPAPAPTPAPVVSGGS